MCVGLNLKRINICIPYIIHVKLINLQVIALYLSKGIDMNEQDASIALGVNLLRALQDPTRHDHAQALEGLEGAVRSGQTEFGQVMLHLFARGTGDVTELQVRQLAGMLVKNFCLRLLVTDDQMLVQALQQVLVESSCDEQPEIRRTSASIIGQLCRGYPTSSWLPLVPHLLNPLQQLVSADLSQHATMAVHPAIYGCTYAIQLISEDGAKKLASESNLLETMFPVLLALLRCPENHVRISALLAIKALLPLLEYSTDSVTEYIRTDVRVRSVEEGSKALIMHIPALLAELSTLTQDAIPEIRCAVCASLVIMIAGPAALLSGCLSDVCRFMLTAVQDKSTDVAKEGLEFWLALLNRNDSHGEIQTHVAALATTCIIYFHMTRDELELKREEAESHASGETFIRLNHRSKGKHGEENGETNTYSLRVMSGRLFEKLTKCFPQEVISTAAPMITVRLNATEDMAMSLPDSDPHFSVIENVSLLRESAMLALGAIVRAGAACRISGDLHGLYPILLSMLEDPMQETRALACWTLSQLDQWVSDDMYSEDEATVERGQINFVQLLQGLLVVMLDAAPGVQDAACNALQHCIETCGCDSILRAGVLVSLTQQIGTAFRSYGVHNKLCLLNLVGCLAQELGADFCAQETGGADSVSHWFPFVLAMFSDEECDATKDNGYVFEVAAECLGEIVAAVGSDIHSYAGLILTRCSYVASQSLTTHATAVESMREEQNKGTVFTSLHQIAESPDSWDLPSKDNVTAALELLTALFDALGTEGVRVLDPSLSPALSVALTVDFQCLQDQETNSCRQAAFGFLASVIESAPWLLCNSVHVDTALNALEVALARFSSCDEKEERYEELLPFNNACYALGVFALAASQNAPIAGLSPDSATQIEAHLSRMSFNLVSAFKTIKGLNCQEAKMTLQTLATCICRLGLVATVRVAVALPEILYNLLSCVALLDVSTERNSEYGHTWCGLLALLHASPRVLLDSAHAGNAFVNLCAQQVAMPMSDTELQGYERMGVQPWTVSPTLLVCDSDINRSIAGILQALAQAQPKTFASLLTEEVKNQLAAFQ